MANTTSLLKPELFTDAPALPTGFHYIIKNVGVYQFGQLIGIYQIGVVNEATLTIVWGSVFYPYNGYPDGQSMITTEATNAYGNWSQYYSAETVALQAQALIGF